LRAPAPVVPECSWQIEQHLGPIAEARFLRLITSSELVVIDLTVADYARCVELIETYADLGLGVVDASVVTVAGNLGVKTVATLNRRDFTVVRARHTQGLELIP
jgi:predicted nucleic acid-binding protein